MNQIPSLVRNFCVVCNSASPQGFTHTPCKTEFSPDRLLSAFAYQNKTVADMIITGKYYFVPEVFAVLGALASEHIFFDAIYKRESKPEEYSALKDFVVCAIPLHARRLRWRGFNQSEIAAKVMAQGLNLPYYPLLQRSKNTQTQKNLDAKSRQTNLANAFKANQIPNFPRKVILVDDVSTTGQTFLEATRVLKQAGAGQVWCVSIAKD